MKHLISQLAHVEILTPKLDGTLWYFRDLLGLEETERQGQSVYLRGWGDWFHHTLKITEAPQSGLGHVGWRADSPEALEIVAKEVGALGLGKGWIDGDRGHGKAFCFTDPDGHPMEVFWEVERIQVPEHLRTHHRARPQKYVGRGAAVRRIDHFNLLTSDTAPCTKFFTETLGFKYNESLREDGTEREVGSWLAATSQMHDIAYTGEAIPGMRERLHHVAFWQDTWDEVMRTADILRDADITIEAGPARHGISDAFFMYTYEPGGNRVELFSGGYLQHTPDWEPIIWHLSEFRYAGSWWGEAVPESFFTYGTPPVEVPAPLASVEA